jgi:dTDP-4-dehydrorhamnose reductase
LKTASILVTGANGQLGSEIRTLVSQYPDFDFHFVDIADVDLADETSVRKFFEDKSFQFIINCAAYTAVDKAEEQVELATKINADAVRLLARIAAEKKMRIIHVSTDYVFSGEANYPLTEESKPAPVSVYGESKLKGEQYLLDLKPDSYIIRTAWVYSTFGKNFVKTIMKLASERKELKIVGDQIGTPTYAADLAKVILTIIDSIVSGKKDQPGLYHYTNEGVASWFDFAFYIQNFFSYDCKIHPIRTEEYPTAARRPKFSLLDKSRIKKVFAVEIPHWTTSLQSCLSKFQQDGGAQ